MWVHFEFGSGSNPYIAKTDDALWDMICKYDTYQVYEEGFFVESQKPLWKRTYENCKEVLREFAKEWQFMSGTMMNYSYGELAEWQDFFRTYGKRFGLLREFRENGIC